MRGILINPWTKEITEVQVGPDITDYYRLLSNPLGPKVDCLTIAEYFKNMDTMYVDDEGLLKSGMRLFDVGRADDSLLAGNGLILGSDRAGNSRDAKSSLVEIQCHIKWTNLRTA